MSAGRWIWPATELGPALATFSGRDAADAGDNPLALAVAHGFDPVPVDWAGPPNAALVRAVAPGWCRTPEGAWLLLARHRLGRVQVVTPQGRRWTGAAAAAGWLVPVRPAWADAIAQAPEVRHSRRLRAADALTPEVPVIEASCVRLNSAPTDPVRRHLRAEGVTGRLALAVLAIVAGYLVVAAQWTVAGRHLLAGDPAVSWVPLWAGLAAIAVVVRVGGQRALGELAVALGTSWKRLVAARAVGLEPDAIHRAGPGWVLGRTFEVDAAEGGAVGGSAVAVVGAVEVVVAGALLGLIPGGTPVLVALLGYLAAVIIAARLAIRRTRAWAQARAAVSARLTELVVEHRSRLVQGLPYEDTQRAQDESGAADRAARRLDALLAGWAGTVAAGWLILALGVLSVSWWSAPPSTGAAAAVLGVVLLAGSGLEALTVAGQDAVDAVVAVGQARELLAMPPPESPAVAAPTPDDELVVMARGVAVRYPDRPRCCLDGFQFGVRTGERVLLHGPSGAGKSTAVAVLADQLRPSAGVVMRRGRIVAVPQAHRNHVFGGTLAFNLLLGRGWPPTASDLDAAEDVCRALGLGGLLDTMPAGLYQLVGETGWQLSDGERVRVFAARALLQDPDLTILDESLGPLDPITAAHCRDAIANLARAVLLTHHP